MEDLTKVTPSNGAAKPIPLKPPKGAQLTVLEQVHYQSVQETPSSFTTRLTRKLATEEQVWQRDLTVESEWKRLDKGWIENCSCLIVRNVAHRFHVVPTKEEKAAVENRFIEIAVGPDRLPFASIAPGDTARWRPMTFDVYLRCSSGQAKASIVLVPE